MNIKAKIFYKKRVRSIEKIWQKRLKFDSLIQLLQMADSFPRILEGHIKKKKKCSELSYRKISDFKSVKNQNRGLKTDYMALEDTRFFNYWQYIRLTAVWTLKEETVMFAKFFLFNFMYLTATATKKNWT